MPAKKDSKSVVAPYEVPSSGQWDGNDGRWSTFDIRIGKPGQEFRVLPSTAGSEVFIPLGGSCRPTDPGTCPTLRGIQDVNGFQSTGFDTNKSSTWNSIGIYDLELDTRLGFKTGGLFGYETIGLGRLQNSNASFEPLVIERQLVAGVQSTDWFLGLLGLNTRPSSFSSDQPLVPSLLRSLKDNGVIPSLSYGYTAGAAYAEKKSVGSLILGGFDMSRSGSTGLIVDFGIEDYIAPILGVMLIVGTNTLNGVVSFTFSGAFQAMIDSSVPDMWLPREVCDRFQQHFNLTYDESTLRYMVNEDVHQKLKTLNPSITFTLANSTRNNGNSINILLPYAALDLQASWPIYNSTTKVFPIRRAANELQYTLGRVLLQEAYLVVDFERQNFTISQALFPQNKTPKDIISIPSTNSTIYDHHSSKLGTRSIVGIAVGAFAAIIIIVLLLWHFRRRHQQERRRGVELETKKVPSEEKETYTATGPAELAPASDPVEIEDSSRGEMPSEWISELQDTGLRTPVELES